MKRRPIILALNNVYLPGFKAGGPIRTLNAIAEQLGVEFEFRIVALDRDTGDAGPYPDLATGVWHEHGPAKVMYVQPGPGFVWRLARIIRETPHDLLYLNSFFSPRFGLIPLLLNRWSTRRVPILIAPRGQFSPGALGLKSLKKRLYLGAARFLYSDIAFQASSAIEAQEIRQRIADNVRVFVASDLAPISTSSLQGEVRAPKARGALCLAFVSRITPKKNLDLAVRLAARVEGPVVLDAYGPVEDAAYFRGVEQLASTVSQRLEFHHRGILVPERVCQVLASYDAFLFPTRGENFGHVIFEALNAGCPPVISDQTPWLDLEASRAGFVVPLEDEEGFVKVLQHLMDMGEEEHASFRAGARDYARRFVEGSANREANVAMFRSMLSEGADAPMKEGA